MFLDRGLSVAEKTSILNQFKDRNTFLLLHPIYTEGISILGAEHLHLLEPIQHLAKKEQVIARVIRYLSHNHLPLNKRHVIIYQWACESTTILSKFQKQLASVRSWLKINPEVFYDQKYNLFEQDMTPDSLVLKQESVNVTNDHQIIKLLRKNKIDYNCCIKYPSIEQETECLEKYSPCS